MRIFSILILIFLTQVNSVVAAEDCSVSYYEISEDGSFKLPIACTGYVEVDFDSKFDLKKLKILDNDAYSKLRKVLTQLSLEKITKHKDILVQAGAQIVSINSSILFTADPPIKKYRFVIGNYIYKGSVRQNVDKSLFKEVK